MPRPATKGKGVLSSQGDLDPCLEAENVIANGSQSQLHENFLHFFFLSLLGFLLL